MFYIGCPMWGYKDWVGNLFPPHTPQSDFLRLYSRQLNTVEGNTTFYALPSAETLAQRFNHRCARRSCRRSPTSWPRWPRSTTADPAAKMSKSSSTPQGIVDVLDEPDVIRRKIARAVTDPGSEVRADPEAKPGVTNLLRIYSALSGEPVATLEANYAGAGYGGFKKDLAELVVATFAPIREKTQQILADGAGLDRVLAHGAAQARKVAGQTCSHFRAGGERGSDGRLWRQQRQADQG